MEASHRTRNHQLDSRSPTELHIEKYLARVDQNEPEETEHLGLRVVFHPSEALIDLVFVHGIWNGSTKTWSLHQNNPAYFWPKKWLSRDPGFKYVRISSYGYNTDTVDRRRFDIANLGEKLLMELSKSEDIKSPGNTSIILIGHSLGGVIIKKVTVNLSKTGPEHADLAQRIRALFFLATPHKDVDSIGVQENIHRAAIKENHTTQSLALRVPLEELQEITDDFKRYQSGVDAIQLWSFYEALATDLGDEKIIVLGQRLATSGLPGEHPVRMEADHLGICRFDKASNPNYRALRDALAKVVDQILDDGELFLGDPIALTILNQITVLVKKREEVAKNMKSLKGFLKITESPDDDRSNQETLRLEGSCAWLTERPAFSTWVDSSRDQKKLFWLHGMPATGKSVLAAYVVHHLESLNYDCTYHFFKTGQATSSVSAMLCSLAYQMAEKNVEVREKLLELQQNESQLSIENSRILWQKLFSQAVFRAEFHQPQFWVIDALDECEDYEALYRHLQEINKEKDSPFRVFVTSRATPQLREFFLKRLKELPYSEEVSKEHTTRDIRRFFKSNEDQLPAEGDQDRSSLIDELTEKSQGCFLWARAILEDLKDAYTANDIEATIRSLPDAMGPLYERTLESMSKSPRTVPLSKAILTWTICATRVLSVEELQSALEYDRTMGENFKAIRLEIAITRSCNHLLYVDGSSKIQIMHATVREFLLKSDLQSEFAIQEKSGNAQLAWSCLKYLTSDEMKPPAYQGRQSKATGNRSEFVKYACMSFSDHLVKSSSEDTQLLNLLAKFFKANVLSWIDVISQGQDLSHLIRVAKNLKIYVDQQKFDQESSQLISEWSTDLIRLVARFGRNLMTSPSAIYFLIPPLCPRRSAIYKAFGSRSQGICVEGLSSDAWDDKLSCITYPRQANTITSRGSYFAVGLDGGDVVLYDTSSCQEIRRVNHGENPALLQFSHNSNIMVSSGARKIKSWVSKTGEQLWEVNMANSPLALSFDVSDKLLRVATRTNHIATYKATDGSEASPMYTLYDQRRLPMEPNRAPAHVQFSAGLEVLAVEYRGSDISLWDLQSRRWLNFCKKPGSHPNAQAVSLTALLFNPDTDLELFVASYFDGDLVLFGISDPKEKAVVHDIDAHVLASSPDGRTLACWSSSSVIRIFEFQTLNMLYFFQCDPDVKGLAFSSDGLRFFDIQEDRCNVWEPSVLVRKDHKKGSIEATISDASQTENPHHSKSKRLYEDDPIITTLILDSEETRILCGIANGDVSLYDAQTGVYKSLLYRQRINVAICAIEAESQNKIASLDTAGRIQVHNIIKTSSGKWSVRGHVQDKTMSETVLQIVLCCKGDRLLVVLAHTSQLWNVSDSLGLIQEHPSSSSFQRLWFKSNIILDGLYCIDQKKILLFDGGTLDEQDIAQTSAIKVYRGFEVPPEIGKDYFLRLTLDFLRNLLSLCESDSNEIQLIEPALYEEEGSLMLSSSFLWLLSRTEQVIGVQRSRSRLIFLDIDHWVCATDISGIKNHRYDRHFIVPFNWLTSNRNLPFQISEDGVIFIGKDEEVVVIKQGLDFGEIVSG